MTFVLARGLGVGLAEPRVTVLIAVLICVFAAARYADAVDYFGPNLPANQVVVYTPSGAAAAGITRQTLCASSGEPAPATLRRDQARVRAIAAALGTSNVLALETATGLLLQTTDGGTDVGQPYVGTPALLAHYGIKASQINRSAVVLTSRAGLATAPALQLPLSCNPSLAQLDGWVTEAGIVLALGVLALTVGLVRSETATDLKVLAASGATGKTRRAITAATAAALGLLGALTGTAVACLAALAYFRSQLSEHLNHGPALDLVLILAGLPAIAAAGGWLFAGRESSMISRQPLK